MDVSLALGVGFLLGVRHASDADHLAAVSTMLRRGGTVHAAAFTGALWGFGHTLSVLVAGAAIILASVRIEGAAQRGIELAVGLLLVALGVRRLVEVARGRSNVRAAGATRVTAVTAVGTGVVHGLGGSAAASLLALGAMPDRATALGYLLVFGAGTVAGMALLAGIYSLAMGAAVITEALTG